MLVISVDPMKKPMDVGEEVVDKHKPIYIQLHGKECVKPELGKDNHLGMIGCVPNEEPVGVVT